MKVPIRSDVKPEDDAPRCDRAPPGLPSERASLSRSFAFDSDPPATYNAGRYMPIELRIRGASMSRPVFLVLTPLALALGVSAFAADPPAAGAAAGAAGAGTGEATATGAPPSTGLTDAEKAAAAEGEFRRELLTTEQDVDKLKERTFRSKATLQLLKELVLEGSSLGSSVVLFHVNQMGSGYTVEEVRYFLDGKNVYAKNLLQGGTADARELEVYDQAVPAGTHNLQVLINLRGNGFGVFSYLQSYSFKLQSSYTFEVADGEQTTVRVIADEKGGLLKSFTDRPNVEYEASSARVKKGAE